MEYEKSLTFGLAMRMLTSKIIFLLNEAKDEQ